MALTLNPDAQNQPDGLSARVANTKRRIEYFGETPSAQQIEALGKVLAMEIQEAYRKAIMREAEKFGIITRGPLDEFTKSSLASYAQKQATSIVSTYTRKQNDARNKGADLGEWRRHYAGWKAPQIMQHEYARADGQAVLDFYSKSTTPDGGLLSAQARVMPLEAKTHDDCELWISYGWVNIHEIIDKFLPRHPNCPHFWFIESGSDSVESDSLPDLPSGDPPIWLPNTSQLLSPTPSSGTHYHAGLLIGGAFLAGMVGGLALARHGD